MKSRSILQNKELLGRILVVLLTLLVVIIRFGSYLQTPNKVIEPYGDGFKAYTVIAYHAKHDSTWTHFEGMNYPYGDHAIPSATQPLLSNTIRFISNYIVDISDYTIAVVNLSMLLSLFLCTFFLFLLFNKLELPWWYAALSAVGICFLSPQLPRFHAHYGLSHLAVLPMLLYLWYRFDEQPHWRTSASLGLLVWAFSLIHFYYFAILAISISFLFLFRLLRKRNWRHLPGYLFHYSLQLLVPLAFFGYWLFSKDPVTDRCPEPWGFFHFHSFLEGIFTSLDQPYFAWFDTHIHDLRRTDLDDLEGRSYIGLVAGITLGMMGLDLVLRKFRKPILRFGEPGTGFLQDSLLAGLVLLVLSFGIPFTFKGMEWLLDYAGPLRQFRSMGRFAWLFYYVINILAIVWCYRRLQGMRLQWPVMLALLALLYFEAWNSAWSRNLDLDEVEEFTPGKEFTTVEGVDYNDFQAVVTVPYYNIGSDQFWWEPEGYILQKSLTLSLQTGLPVTSAMLTRSSRSQTLKQLQLVTEPYRYPVLLDDLPDDRPFLMVLDQPKYEAEAEKYAHLLEGASLIYSKGDRLRMYRLPLNSFENRLNSRFRRLDWEIENDSTLVWEAGMACRDAQAPYFFDDLAGYGPSERIYFGAGGFQGKADQVNPLDIPNLPKQEAGKVYNLSLWMYIADDRRTRSNFELLELDADGNVRMRYEVPCRELVSVFDSNGWGLMEYTFTATEADSRFQVVVSNSRLRGESLFLDDLLVRPVDVDVFGRGEQYIWKNNRHYLRE